MTGGVLKKEYYRVDEVARLFDVHIKTVYRWIDEGKLKVIRTPSKNTGQMRIARETIQKLFSGEDS